MGLGKMGQNHKHTNEHDGWQYDPAGIITMSVLVSNNWFENVVTRPLFNINNKLHY